MLSCPMIRQKKRAADYLQNSRTAHAFCGSDSAQRSRDIELRKCRQRRMREINGFAFFCSVTFEQIPGSSCSRLSSIVGEALNFIRVKTDFSGGEVELLQVSLVHIRPERRSGYAENRHGFPGVDQMTSYGRLFATAKDAFCLFLGNGSVRPQESLDCVDGRLCHVFTSFRTRVAFSEMRPYDYYSVR